MACLFLIRFCELDYTLSLLQSVMLVYHIIGKNTNKFAG